MLNEAVFPLVSFYHLSFLLPEVFTFSFFLFSNRWSTLLGLRYRWDTATSGHFGCSTSPTRLHLFTTPPSCHAPLYFPPFPGLFSVASPLTHVLLLIVSSLQHLLFLSYCLSVFIHVYSLFHLALWSSSIWRSHWPPPPVSVIIYTVLPCYCNVDGWSTYVSSESEG